MAYFLLVISVLIFASSLVGIRAALVDYEPLELAVFRFVIASVTLAAYSLVAKIRLLDRKDLKMIISAGFIFFVNIITANYGLLTIKAGEASFILNLVPLLTAGLAVLILKEKLSPRFVIGLVVSFIGVSLIALTNSERSSFNFGIVFLLLAAITFALFQITQKRLLTDYSPAQVTCFAIWIATALFLPFGHSLPGSIGEASLGATISALYLGVFPSALAYIVWFTALKKIPVARASSFFYFTPVFTIIIGYLWLNEIPSLVSIGGGALVIAGVIIGSIQREKH
jgi:drug/metabolite transporter (DMT)-like permease